MRSAELSKKGKKKYLSETFLLSIRNSNIQSFVLPIRMRLAFASPTTRETFRIRYIDEIRVECEQKPISIEANERVTEELSTDTIQNLKCDEKARTSQPIHLAGGDTNEFQFSVQLMIMRFTSICYLFRRK